MTANLSARSLPEHLSRQQAGFRFPVARGPASGAQREASNEPSGLQTLLDQLFYCLLHVHANVQ